MLLIDRPHAQTGDPGVAKRIGQEAEACILGQAFCSRATVLGQGKAARIEEKV